MKRADFKKLANLRIREARILLDNKQYAGAYYLAGYAVECALKACIARQTKLYDFPPDLETTRGVYIHDLTRLLHPAGLKVAHANEVRSNPKFDSNGSIVKDWSEQSRYDYSIADISARDLYVAIVDRQNGVLTWLKKYW